MTRHTLQRNDLEKLRRLRDKGQLTPSELGLVTVRHAVSCPMAGAGSSCYCSPEVWIGRRRIDETPPPAGPR